MPRFAANLSFLFTEHPFIERFERAAKAGFGAVEYLFPYEFDKRALADELKRNDLTQALINSPAGDWDAGDRGLACLPDRRGEFRDGIARALDYATALGCHRVHVVAGLKPEALARADATAVYVENLRLAADIFAPHGITATIEPINQRDMPGFFLSSSKQALELLSLIERQNVKLQFDVYHTQITEGDLTHRLRSAIRHIGHIQIANPPDRCEPDFGEINFPFVFEQIDALGYDGFIGCEYHPRADTLSSLAWADEFDIG